MQIGSNNGLLALVRVRDWIQRTIPVRLALGRQDLVPNKKTIISWVSKIRERSSDLKKTSSGWLQIVTRPVSVVLVSAWIEHSQKRSVRKHAAAQSLSDWSVRRILRLDMKLHPYKIFTVQDPGANNFQTRQRLSEDIARNVPPIEVLLC